jgi:hypothetical protein
LFQPHPFAAGDNDADAVGIVVSMAIVVVACEPFPPITYKEWTRPAAWSAVLRC